MYELKLFVLLIRSFTMLRFYFVLVFSFFVTGVFCQKKVTLHFKTNDYKKVTTKLPNDFKSTTEAIRFLKELQIEAIKKGYLGASVDSIQITENNVTTSFDCGNKYKNIQLTSSKEGLELVRSNARISEKMLLKTPVQPIELSRVMKEILNACTSSGYPFAKCYLKNLKENNQQLSAELIIEKGAKFQLTEIHVKGDSSIALNFISTLTNLKIGEEYNEKILSDLSRKITQLNYIKEIKPFELLFTEHGFEVFLYLKSVPISSLNGVVGLQQNANNSDVNLTGELDLKLVNVLKRGEQINLNWRSIQAQTQNLKATINYPFLFKTKFGFDGQFQLYKRDTTFLELKTMVGAQYQLNSGNYLTLFYQNTSSSRLGGSSNNPLFSNLSNVSTHAYGISYFNRSLDYIPNPSRGKFIQASIAVGNRNSTLNDTSKTTTSTTYKGNLKIEFYLPITARNIIRIAANATFYIAPTIYQNEVDRFGGQTTLRGFNEEELYATTKSIASIEYRYLLDKNSNVFAFFDQAFLENNAVTFYKDTPFGFGVGFSFGTKIGLFSVSYALGKQYSNPILFSNGKVHFGYIAYF